MQEVLKALSQVRKQGAASAGHARPGGSRVKQHSGSSKHVVCAHVRNL
jgi:hypothetical protein